MNEELNRAFEQISDNHINEAAVYQKKRFPWIRAIAAVLAVVICWTALWAAFNFPPTIIFPDDASPSGPILQDNTLPPSFTVPGSTVPDVPIVPTPPDPTVPDVPIAPTMPDPVLPTAPVTPIIPDPGPVVVPLSGLVASPTYPKMMPRPKLEDYSNYKEYNTARVQWNNEQKKQYDQPTGYADSLDDFWSRSMAQFLSGDGNRAYSPLNVYMAMAMLAETTDGNSRQQILDLLGVDSISALRTQVDHIWNAHYRDDGETTSLLANSLWLDNTFPYKDEAAQALAGNYYASVFHGDLGTDEMNKLLQEWLNEQTGGLLEEQAKSTELDPGTVFALASTAYFAAGWDISFDLSQTADRVFHSPGGDLTAPFMNQTTDAQYYWSTNFSAVELKLSSGSMWLILPDEGISMEEVLNSAEYLQLTQNPYEWKDQQYVWLNLSLPKFDIDSKTDLIEGMKQLGISDVFSYDDADFTPITDMPRLAVVEIDHAVRVAIDEEGVLAAAYTVIEAEPDGAPCPDDEIDFVLDRPFLFVVSSPDRLPLFAGVVEQP